MKLFKATLMVCSAMVLNSNVNAMESKSSSGDSSPKASASSSAENSFMALMQIEWVDTDYASLN